MSGYARASRRLLERSGQSQFVAHFADGREHFLFHQLEAAHRILMADRTVVGPHTEDAGTQNLKALADFLDHGLGTADDDAIAINHGVPAGGVNATIQGVRFESVFVLFEDAFAALAGVVAGGRHEIAGHRDASDTGVADEETLADFESLCVSILDVDAPEIAEILR